MDSTVLSVLISVAGVVVSCIYAWKSSEKAAEKAAKEACREVWEERNRSHSQRPEAICSRSTATVSESTPTNASE